MSYKIIMKNLIVINQITLKSEQELVEKLATEHKHSKHNYILFQSYFCHIALFIFIYYSYVIIILTALIGFIFYFPLN